MARIFTRIGEAVLVLTLSKIWDQSNSLNIAEYRRSLYNFDCIMTFLRQHRNILLRRQKDRQFRERGSLNPHRREKFKWVLSVRSILMPRGMEQLWLQSFPARASILLCERPEYQIHGRLWPAAYEFLRTRTLPRCPLQSEQKAAVDGSTILVWWGGTGRRNANLRRCRLRMLSWQATKSTYRVSWIIRLSTNQLMAIRGVQNWL